MPAVGEALVCEMVRCNHESLSLDNIILTLAGLQDAVYRIVYRRNTPVTCWQQFRFWLLVCCKNVYTFACPPWPPCIINKVAFIPCKPTYDFVPFGRARNEEYRLRLSSDCHCVTFGMVPIGQLSYQQLHALLRCFYVSKTGQKGKRIACVYWPMSLFSLSQKRNKAILFSHSNGVDLGLIGHQIVMLGHILQADVVGYDYSGYGRSDGPCSEENLYKDAECVYDFMVKRMKIPGKEIVAIGTSLGTAATIHLASKRPISAAVLQGSFASALRSLCPKRKGAICLDRFVNVEKIASVTCPTLFVHGDDDTMFTLDHVELLRAKCPGAAAIEPLIIKNCGHSEFECYNEYWTRLRKFIHWEIDAPPGPQNDESITVAIRSGRSDDTLTSG